MKPLWVIARREFAGIFTERTILLAVVIQIFVAGFSSFLVVGLSALFDPTALPGQAPPLIAVDPLAAEDEQLRRAASAAGLSLLATESTLHAFQLFDAGAVDGAIIKALSEDDRGSIHLTLVLPDGQLSTTMTLVKVKDALERYERELRDDRDARLVASPLYLDSETRSGSFGFVYSLLIPLLVFLPIVLSGALTADSLTEEVQRGTLPLLLASPATAADIVQGKLLANVSLTPLLSLAWFLLLALNGLTVPIAGAIAIMVLGSAIAFLMGLLACVIALATRDRNQTHVLYAMGMFFLLAVSLVLPVSPINAVALFAAGSPGPAAYATAGFILATALAGWLALSLGLRRANAWMSTG